MFTTRRHFREWFHCSHKALLPDVNQEFQLSDLNRSALIPLWLNGFAAPANMMGIIQRKCGADFRSPNRRLWKDPVMDKRHNTPHSNRYGISGHEECALPLVSIRKWVLSVSSSWPWKLPHFLLRICEKHFHKYVMPYDICRKALQM